MSTIISKHILNESLNALVKISTEIKYLEIKTIKKHVAMLKSSNQPEKKSDVLFSLMRHIDEIRKAFLQENNPTKTLPLSKELDSVENIVVSAFMNRETL